MRIYHLNKNLNIKIGVDNAVRFDQFIGLEVLFFWE